MVFHNNMTVHSIFNLLGVLHTLGQILKSCTLIYSFKI